MEKSPIKSKLKSLLVKDGALKFYSGLLCILIGIIIGLIIFIILSPKDAFSEYIQLFVGGFKLNGLEYLGEILEFSAPLICCSLCILFAYKTGVFNIGIAGQYTMGVFASLVFSLHFHWGWFPSMLMAIIFGAIWASIPAILKVFCSVNEVISGIMLNWIALFLTNHCFNTYFKDCIRKLSGGKTEYVTGASRIPGILNDTFGSKFSIAVILAIVIAIVIQIIISKTTLGYQLTASGLNKHATKYAGMNEKRNIIVTMAIAGALAGLGASFYYLTNLEQWNTFSSSATPSLPWNGIVVAFVAQLNPIGSIFVSFFITLLSRGGSYITQATYPKETSDLITGIIIYASGLVAIFRLFIVKLIEKKKKEKELKEQGGNK